MSAPRHAGKLLVDALGQQRAVCKPAQRIVESQEAAMRFGFAERGDVGDDGDEQRN